MKNILSPKVLYTVFFSLIVAFSAWFWRFSPASTEVAYTKINLTASAGQNAFIDTDKDGLQDWEEALWKTDPKNPDSDGDGIKDGDEAQENADNQGAITDSSEDLGEPPNLTEAFSGALARSLGPRILEDGGLSNIPLSEIQTAASYLPQADAIMSDPVKIKVSELRISEKNDSASVKKYFESVFGIYKKTFFTLKEDDSAILLRVFTNENFSELSALDPIIKAFSDSFSELKKLPVPKGWEGFAITELENLARSQQFIEKFRNSGSDPMATLILLPKRVELQSEMRKFHQDTGKMLIEKGIMFNESEETYILFQ